MEQKHKLTENLKALETEVYNKKIDLNSLMSKLESSYKYEDELLQRLEFAKKQTKILREECFKTSTSISNDFEKIKDILDIFTSNFYTI